MADDGKAVQTDLGSGEAVDVDHITSFDGWDDLHRTIERLRALCSMQGVSKISIEVMTSLRYKAPSGRGTGGI